MRTASGGDLLNLTLAPSSLNALEGLQDAGDLLAAEHSLFRSVLKSEDMCF